MFAGLFTTSDAPPPDAWVDTDAWLQALSPFVAPDIAGVWRHGNALLVEAQRFNTPSSRHAREAPYQDGGLAVAFWGRLDNRKELASILGIDGARLDTLPDAGMVSAAWRRWGEDLPQQLVGDFALAVVDRKQHSLFLARDPLGVKPLYYWPHAEGLVFATTAAALRCLKGMEPTPDPDWMARYLLHISMSHERTGYREIMKLPGGHSLHVDGEGRMRLHRWHQWRDDAPEADRRDPRWLEAYREVLEEAVRCRMDSDYPLGSENSGGIDSATVTAYAAKILGEPGERLHSFGFAIHEQEPEFILETSRKTGIVHNHIVSNRSSMDGDGRQMMARYLTACGYPQEHGNATGHTVFYRECEMRGIRTLFSGFGGDEVVTNPGGHLRCELLDQRRYGALWDILPGNPVTKTMRVGKAVASGYPRPEYNPNLLQAWYARWPLQPLSPQVVERLELHTEYMETARYDAPYRRVNSWIIDGLLLSKPFIPTRMENCTLMAAAYGIDYRWPLWDARLVQQYLSTPGIEKVGPQGIGRYLHRRAITGTVPDKVAWKPSKDMGYAAVQQARNDTDIIKSAATARREVKRMHSAVAELLDLPKWRQQIERAEKGKVPAEFGFVFRRTATAVRWLNHWLHEG